MVKIAFLSEIVTIWKLLSKSLRHALCQLHQSFIQRLRFCFSSCFFFQLGLVETLRSYVAFLPHSILVRTLKKTILLLVFPIIIYLPHLLFSGGQPLFLLRLPLIALAIAYYSETSTISEMLAALKGLHFPDLVLLQIDITIKYIDVFGKQLMDLLKGIEARSFGGNHRFRIGSNIWGILYLKAIRYGEELTQAMEARCFVGEYVKSSQSFTWKDWLALISLVAVILGQILLGG